MEPRSVAYCILLSLLGIGLRSQAQLSGLPTCILEMIMQAERDTNSRLISVRKVSVKGQNLYYFESLVFSKPKKPGRPPLPVYYAYLDSNCKVAASYTLGGIIGIRVTPGYSIDDFFLWRTSPALWKRKTLDLKTSGKETPPPSPYSQPQKYKIVKVEIKDSAFHFSLDDEINISQRNGLYYYRKGMFFNRYLVVPKKYRVQNSEIYYLEWDNIPFRIVQLGGSIRFQIANSISEEINGETIWKTIFLLKKL
ncbi:hypothetical protein ACFOWA_17550 [Pedobacter lithocola]|uniref:Outer membrane lipoprotein-sorting protein n=1 Tax=Pedobacter lithocola TaxID=1908239 RepID=A0ABV8PG14_9SPHI